MSTVRLTGTYVEFPAQIIVDPTVQESVLSTQFACSHNVPRNVLTVRGVAHVSASGPVVVPTADGWFHSSLPFKIIYSTRCDVLLGADWLAACQPRFLHGGILRPSEASLARLPIGHSWVPIPVSEDSCQRACLLFVCLSLLQITNRFTILSFSFFVPSKAARAGSSHLTHDNASTSDQCPPKLQAVIDSFVEETLPNYVFSTDTKQMHELMLSHGLHDRNLNRNECERALCYHILNGLCAAIPADNNLRRSACSDISGSCSSPAELQNVIFGLVIEHVALRMSLKTFRRLCASIDIREHAFAQRKVLIARFQERRDRLQRVVRKQSLLELFDHFDGMRKPMLINIAIGHGLQVDSSWTIDDLRNAITKHVTGGQCCSPADEDRPTQCQSISDELTVKDPELDSSDEIQSRILESIVDKLSASPLRRILQIHEVPFEKGDSISQLRRRLRKYTRSLRKGKRCHLERHLETNRRLRQVRAEWPRIVPNDLKERIHKLFREQTSSERLKEFTCASCAQSRFVDERAVLPASELDSELLRRPDMHDMDVDTDSDDDEESERQQPWLDSDCVPPVLPFTDGPLQNLLLDPAGVDFGDDGEPALSLCQECCFSLEKGVVPPLSLANRMFLGEVPDELKDLTAVEESMIALCRAKCCIVQLKEDNENATNTINQRGMKGHIIIYPQ
jgi:hypothetical protein